MTIGNVFGLNQYDLLMYSGFFNLLLLPLFALAANTDRKTHEVSGWVCLALMGLIMIHAVCLNGHAGATLLAGVCALLMLGPIESAIFGQADYILIAHLFTGYTWTRTGMSLLAIASVCWLVCLSIHLYFYRDQYGDKWKPFSGVMIPAIPSYTGSVLIMAILRLIITPNLFFAGF